MADEKTRLPFTKTENGDMIGKKWRECVKQWPKRGATECKMMSLWIAKLNTEHLFSFFALRLPMKRSPSKLQHSFQAPNNAWMTTDNTNYTHAKRCQVNDKIDCTLLVSRSINHIATQRCYDTIWRGCDNNTCYTTLHLMLLRANSCIIRTLPAKLLHFTPSKLPPSLAKLYRIASHPIGCSGALYMYTERITSGSVQKQQRLIGRIQLRMLNTHSTRRTDSNVSLSVNRAPS